MRYCVLIIFVCFLAVPSASANDDSLPPSISLILEKAADRDAASGTTTYLDAAVVLAIDSYPDYAGSILDRAKALAPRRSGTLTARAENTFPNVDFTAPPPAPVVAEAEPDAPPPLPGGFFSFSGWDGSAELGGTLNSGNTDEQAVTVGLGLTNDRQTWRHKLGISFAFTRTDGQTTKQDLEASYQLDYKFSERLYAFGLIEYEDDRFSGFDYRLTETLGVGYRLFDRETWFLDVEGGVSFRQSKLALTGISENDIGGRAKAVFHWDITDTFALDNEASALFTGNGTTLENTISVQTKITETISGKLSFNVKHNTDVPLGARKTDTETKASVLYSF